MNFPTDWFRGTAGAFRPLLAPGQTRELVPEDGVELRFPKQWLSRQTNFLASSKLEWG